jgi:hypothetical protein
MAERPAKSQGQQPPITVNVSLTPPSQTPQEYAPPSVQRTPDTYEVMRIFQDAEQEAVVRLFMFPSCACACGHTSCAGSGS